MVHRWRQIFWLSSTIKDSKTVYVFIHRILLYNILSTCFVTTHVDLDHLAEVAFVRFLHYKITLVSPFPYCGLWKEVTAHSLHLKTGDLCPLFLRTEHLHNLLRILLQRKCASSPPLTSLHLYGFMDIHLYFGL